MIEINKQWNSVLKDLKIKINKKDSSINQVRDQMKDLHGYTHSSSVSGKPVTLYDELWSKRGNTDFTSITERNIYSIAWHLWHAARIEDITCSYFVSREEEILYQGDFDKQLNIPYKHTGNSMDFSEMKDFNSRIDLEQLHEFRYCVGKRTQHELGEIIVETLNKKVSNSALVQITKKGSVIDADKGLLSYWGRKKISGIVTMPLTRHLLVHLNSALRLT